MKRRLSLLVLVAVLCSMVPGVEAGTFQEWVAKREARKQQNREFRNWIAAYDKTEYQQTDKNMVDPKGDAWLMRKLDTMPMKFIKVLVEGSYPQAEIDKEKELEAMENALKHGNGEYKIGKTPSVHPDRLINVVRQIIQKYYPRIVPHIGTEHEWSPEAQRYLMYGFWHRMGRLVTLKQKEIPLPLFFRSKLFLLLGCGWTSRYAVTGTEQALIDRLLLYPDRKVQIHHVFMESYVLSRGDLYLTLLTAENVLAGNVYRVDRHKDPLQMKLAYIRNDSGEYGDNYGAWYHWFGISMYGLVRAPFISRAVAEIESLGSIVLEGFDKQEDFINRYGAIFGRKLNRMIHDKTWMVPLKPTDRTDYLDQPLLQNKGSTIGTSGKKAP
jgi:hypothetical protein